MKINLIVCGIVPLGPSVFSFIHTCRVCVPPLRSNRPNRLIGAFPTRSKLKRCWLSSWTLQERRPWEVICKKKSKFIKNPSKTYGELCGQISSAQVKGNSCDRHAKKVNNQFVLTKCAKSHAKNASKQQNFNASESQFLKICVTNGKNQHFNKL